jgi:hypothetical protein
LSQFAHISRARRQALISRSQVRKRECRRAKTFLRFLRTGVDNTKGRSLYTPHSARPPPRRDGAPLKLLTDSGEQASDKYRGLGLRRFFSVPEGGIALAPRSLTSESEERETWTAESWRGRFLARGAAGRDFGGTRFRFNTMDRASDLCVTDLVKRCDQPVQSSHPT